MDTFQHIFPKKTPTALKEILRLVKLKKLNLRAKIVKNFPNIAFQERVVYMCHTIFIKPMGFMGFNVIRWLTKTYGIAQISHSFLNRDIQSQILIEVEWDTRFRIYIHSHASALRMDKQTCKVCKDGCKCIKTSFTNIPGVSSQMFLVPF